MQILKRLHSSKLWFWTLLLFFSTQHVFSASRFQRDTDNINNEIESIAHLTRVANGIALEIGLVDGTVNPGEAIAELLHMGSLTVDDITNLKQDKIDDALNALRQVTPSDPKIEKFENRLISLEKLRMIAPAFVNPKDVTGLKEYKEVFDSLSEFKKLEAGVKKVKHVVDRITFYFNLMKTEPDLALATIEMLIIFHNIDPLVSLEQFFDSVIIKIMEAKRVQRKSSFIKTLLDEVQFREALYNSNIYETIQPALLESFKNVHEIAEKANNARKYFESTQKLVQTRGPLHRQDFKHTHGFPDGLSDFLGLSGDVSRLPKEIPNRDTVKDGLEKSLNPLQKLERNLAVASDQWVNLKGETESKEVANVIDHVLRLANFHGASDAIINTINELKKCEKINNHVYPSPERADLDIFESAISKLDQVIGDISVFDYFSYFKNLEEIKQYFDVESKTGEEKDEFVKGFLKKLKTDEKLKTLDHNVNLFHQDLEILMEFIKNPTQSVDFTNLEKHMRSFSVQFYPNYQPFLTCLGKIDSKSFPVTDIVEFIQESRKFVVPFKVRESLKKVVRSGKSLKSAKISAASLKNKKSHRSQIKILQSAFKNDGYQEISENLGRGVRGLITMKKIHDVELGDLVGSVNDILRDAKMKGLSDQHQKSLQQLELVPKVLETIDEFISNQVSRRKRDFGVDEFQRIFTSAEKVKGADIDMASLREAMVYLNRVTSNKYAVSMDRLDYLENLDLNFTNFKFNEASTSLAGLNEFFAAYHSILTTPPTTPWVNPNIAPLCEIDHEKINIEVQKKFGWLVNDKVLNIDEASVALDLMK